ncbi:MAG: glycosyltransferase family 2 protein [Nostoc sp. DedQUE01]|nr:glycosyltransferase family 2 protein [Nostoc sp. DedQUE01]
MKTPVALFIFNRPDNTEKVFQAIRQAKPPQLLVIADGYRKDKVGELEKCEATRAIIEQVDWNCEVLKNYSDVNLGCGKRLATGINWVFEQVNEAIFLEDDCLPQPTFFKFCETMLEMYSHDERIMTIAGCNPLIEWKSDIQSYHFAYYGGVWGWASWKRAWKYFDYEIKFWSDREVRQRIGGILANNQQFKTYDLIFSETFKNPEMYNAWSYQWLCCRLSQSGLVIVPAVNLISNIGFDNDATHTTQANSGLAKMTTMPLEFPLKINHYAVVDRDYDKTFYEKYLKLSYFSVFKKKIKSYLFSK